MSKCLVCNADVEPFIDFGPMPIANGFLREDQFAAEPFFGLKVGHCPSCAMVQLTELIDRDKLFHGDYAFFSSTSARMAQHFEQFAGQVMSSYASGPDPFVVELGSNDGIMLRHFAAKGIRHLGVEPSANVAKVAADKGIQTVCAFFDEELAAKIVSDHGQAAAIMAANVMCHIPYLHSVAAGIKCLLAPEGVLVFEDPYLGDIVAKTSYDQIYDEHAFYFSATSVANFFARYDLELVDVEHQETHGGSMRYTLGHRGARKPSPAVAAQQVQEQHMGLQLPATYDRFRKNVERSRDQLMTLLRQLKAEGKRVVGYGATSKSTTVTAYCGITPDLVEFISDTTPTKQNKFSPGAHIPVRPYADFKARYPDYALLFAWNHGQEIMAKETDFKRAGGKFIGYVPKVEILG